MNLLDEEHQQPQRGRILKTNSLQDDSPNPVQSINMHSETSTFHLNNHHIAVTMDEIIIFVFVGFKK